MSSSTPPTIANSLRILYLSPPDTVKLGLLEGDNLPISTPYYSANIPIWHDQTPVSSDAIQYWEAEWRAEEAGEVVRSIGAWVVAIQKPLKKDGLGLIRTLLTTLSNVVTHHTSEAVDSFAISNEPLLLCLGVHQPTVPRLELSDDDWEDLCRECGGWEWIDVEVEGKGKNEFGEKLGIARLLEALEAHEWENTEDGPDLPDDLLAIGSNDLSNEKSTAQLLDELDEIQARDPLLSPSKTDLESKSAVKASKPHSAGLGAESRGKGDGDGTDFDSDSREDNQVQELESMMLKLQAVKDMGADLPEAERRRLAKKAVGDVLRTM